jgi:sugar/nucleoside kinase (ribokinase family)
MGPRHIDADRIKKSEWLFIEGYLLANPGTGQEAVRHAVAVAKAHGTKIALTCSDAFIVTVFGDMYFEVLKQADLLFCNASEAMATTRTDSALAAFQQLNTLVPNAVVTDGPHGAHVRYQGIEAHVPAFAAEPKDLTGAGDMFAGGYLYGITHGLAPQVAARGANYLAMKVISQIGARMHHGVRELWMEAMRG